MQALDSKVFEALHRTVGEIDSLDEIEVGLSSSLVWKVVPKHASSFALKSFPLSHSLERLTEVHTFQQRMGSIDQVPKLIPWSLEDLLGSKPLLFKAADSWWELSTWHDGMPIGFDRFGIEQIGQVISILNRMHSLSKSWVVNRIVSPGIRERTEQLIAFKANSIRVDRDVAQVSEAEPKEILRGIVEHGRNRFDRLITSLQSSMEPHSCIWICRDVQREHLLFKDQLLRGFIDFGASRIDAPILDLVRFLSTSVPTSNRDLWFEAWSLYMKGDQKNLTEPRGIPFERFLILAEASLFLSGLYWCSQLAQPEKYSKPSEVIRQRIHLVLAQLDGFLVN